jgi:hypothetical protein
MKRKKETDRKDEGIKREGRKIGGKEEIKKRTRL